MQNLSWKWIALVAVVVIGLIGALVVGGVTDVDVGTVVAALVSGLAGLLGPARAKGGGSGPGMGPASIILAVLMLGGCGAAQVSAESARVVACDQVGEQWVSRAEDGQITPDEAEARMQCTRAVCDAMHRAILDAGDE